MLYFWTVSGPERTAAPEQIAAANVGALGGLLTTEASRDEQLAGAAPRRPGRRLGAAEARKVDNEPET